MDFWKKKKKDEEAEKEPDKTQDRKIEKIPIHKRQEIPTENPIRRMNRMDDPFNFFSDIDGMDKMFRELMKGFSRMDMSQGGEMGQPAKYGFTIKIGPQGEPKFEEFGNVKRMEGKPVVANKTEPLVDVNSKGNEITITAEMPGVEKKDLEVRTEGSMKVIISTEKGKNSYYKEIELKEEVVEGSAKAKFNNGILEVTLKKKNPKKGTSVKIE